MHRRWLAILLPMLLAACSDGSGSSEGPGPVDDDAEVAGPLDEATRLPDGLASARLTVDVATGQVLVTALSGRPSRAMFTGGSIDLAGETLLDQPGNTGRKVLGLTLTNRSGEALGNYPRGFNGSIRLIVGPITSVAAFAVDQRQASAVDTYAGSGAPGATDGPAATATFQAPVGLAARGRDDWYVADHDGHRIRRIAGGLVSLYAGAGVPGGTDGVGSNARFNNPAGLAVMPGDEALIVAENTGHRIRRIDATGRVTTIAGDGIAGDADGLGGVARFRNPIGVAVTPDGLIWVAEAGGHRVRRIGLTGANPRNPDHWTVATIAGNGTAGYLDGGGGSARFDSPAGLTAGPAALYIADRGNHRIRRMSLNGDVTTVAGSGAAGGANGPAEAATFNAPYGVLWVDGVLLVTERDGHRIRKVQLEQRDASPVEATSWYVSAVAGSSAADVDGNGFIARFNRPRLLADDGAGTILIAETDNRKVRRLLVPGGLWQEGPANGAAPPEPVRLTNYAGLLPSAAGQHLPYLEAFDALADGGSMELPLAFVVPEGTGAFEFTVTVSAPTSTPAPVQAATGAPSPDVFVRTVAGGSLGWRDGPAVQARFDVPWGICRDPSGNTYVADSSNDVIRRIDPQGEVVTIAGRPDLNGSADGHGGEATFAVPIDIAYSPRGFLLVTDLANHRLRLLQLTGADPTRASDWTVSTVAGSASGYAGGTGTVAQFASPFGLCFDDAGTAYITEYAGHRVRSMRLVGTTASNPDHWRVDIIAGSSTGSTGSTDGTGTNARFTQPQGIDVGPAGELYLVDFGNRRIRRIDEPGGSRAVTTFAGSTDGYLDGLGTNAQLDNPQDLTVDAAGYVYVTDRARLRRISPTARVETIAGTSNPASVDGPGDVALLDFVTGVTVDPSGTIWFGEIGGRIRTLERIVRSSGGG